MAHKSTDGYAVGCVLAAKIYFTISLWTIIGIYSLLTSFVLLSILILSYFKYNDPYLNARNIDVSNGPLISIVVPAKMKKKYTKCVQSCLNQTYEQNEIIIVNDGAQTNW